MGVECASCGQILAAGQSRCAHCGAVADGGATALVDGNGASTAAATPQASAPADPSSSMRTAEAPAAAAPAAASLRGSLDDEREPAVPRGTFASEVPERGPEPELPRGDGVPKAELPATKLVPAPAPSSSQRVKTVRAAQRPPYLASEILREDLAPSEPGRREMILVLHLAPLLGALAALISGLQRAATWVTVAVLAGLFALTRFELSYKRQSTIVALAGLGSLALVTGWRMALGGGWDGPLLALSTTLLAAALLYRSWYRVTASSRALVALALVLCATWAAMSSHRELLALEFSWQSWLPALTWYLFGLLCLLSLLAFMGGETTGGCDVWALGLMLWYGLYAGVRFALETSTLPGIPSGNVQTLGLVEPALAAPTAVAFAQLFARSLGARSRRV